MTDPKVRQRSWNPELSTGVAGVLTALLLFASLPEPAEGISGAAMRRFQESHLGETGIAVMLGSGSLLTVVLLVVGLRKVMAEAGASPTLTDLATVSGTLVSLWFWVGLAVGAMPLVMANDSGRLTAYSDDSLLVLDLFSRFSETFGDIGAVPRALFLASVSLAVVTTRFVPRWLGQLGLFVALATLIGLGAGSMAFLGVAFMVGLFGFVLWTFMISMALCVQGARGARGVREITTEPQRPVVRRSRRRSDATA